MAPNASPMLMIALLIHPAKGLLAAAHNRCARAFTIAAIAKPKPGRLSRR
jgi:hypothetical protein